jgi:hypothetical protein
LESKIIAIRDRVKEIERKYKSLANWGRPYLVSLEEVATIYYLNSKLNISLDRLSHFIGVDKTSLYKLIKRIEEENRVSIYNEETKRVEVLSVRPEELIAKAEELIGVSTKAHITDPFQSSIVKKFWESDIEKRAKIRGKPVYLSEKDKKETLREVKRLMEYFASKGLPTNPDMWEEKEVRKSTLGDLQGL